MTAHYRWVFDRPSLAAFAAEKEMSEVAEGEFKAMSVNGARHWYLYNATVRDCMNVFRVLMANRLLRDCVGYAHEDEGQ
jgi:hypothetical protein